MIDVEFFTSRINPRRDRFNKLFGFGCQNPFPIDLNIFGNLCGNLNETKGKEYFNVISKKHSKESQVSHSCRSTTVGHKVVPIKRHSENEIADLVKISLFLLNSFSQFIPK